MKVLIEEKIQEANSDKLIYFLKENGACIEQFPIWASITGKSGNNKCFKIIDENENLHAFCLVDEAGRFIKSAQINFGPVVDETVTYFEFLSGVIDYYKKLGYAKLLIRLAEPISAKTEFLSYLLHKHFQAKDLMNKDLNWSSLQISLLPSIDEISRTFSKGHKSAIKRGQRECLTVNLATEETLYQFSKIFCDMYLSRGKKLIEKQVSNEFMEIFSLFKNLSLGDIFVVKRNNDQVVGGLMIVYQGKQARYFRGATSPNSRDLPILHVGIYEALCHAKKIGMTSFDLWGYNHLVDETDQRFHINKFKKGFSDNFVFYARPIEIILSHKKTGLQSLIQSGKSKFQFKKSN